MVSCSGWLCGGVNPLDEKKTAHIIDNIGQPDPDCGLSEAYGSDE